MMSVPVVSERHHRSTIQLTIQHCNEVSGNICTKIQHKIHTQKPDKVTKQVVAFDEICIFWQKVHFWLVKFNFFGNKILQYSRHGSNNITVQLCLHRNIHIQKQLRSQNRWQHLTKFDVFFNHKNAFFNQQNLALGNRMLWSLVMCWHNYIRYTYRPRCQSNWSLVMCWHNYIRYTYRPRCQSNWMWIKSLYRTLVQTILVQYISLL